MEWKGCGTCWGMELKEPDGLLGLPHGESRASGHGVAGLAPRMGALRVGLPLSSCRAASEETWKGAGRLSGGTRMGLSVTAVFWDS